MLINDEEALEEIGEQIGRGLKRSDRPHVIALVGELGVGKTTLTRGIARGLGVAETATSPTFVIAKQYPITENRTFWHIDAYRLMGSDDLLALDFHAMVGKEGNVTVIEWADRIEDAVPKNAAWLYLAHHKDGRTIDGLKHYGI